MVLAALAALAAACTVSTSAAAPSSPRVEDLVAQFAALQVAPEDTGAHYDRDDWPHWSELPGGCDTRATALREQGREVITGRQCWITGGIPTRVYTTE